MRLRDAIAMLIFFAIYTPLSVLIWKAFNLPDIAMILIFLLGIFYVVLYLLLAILLTPPKKVKRIEPEIIEVKKIEQKVPKKKIVRIPKKKTEPKVDSQKEEVAKPKRKYKKRKQEQEIVVPNSREEEAETFTAPEELPLPFSSPEETNDLD